MGSFLKYLDIDGEGQDKIFWGRAKADGAPFRGPKAVVLREDQYEALAERVNDAKVGTFDLAVPEQRETYKQILDRAANKWYKILFVERQFIREKKNWVVYIEWLEPHMEIPQSRLNGPNGE